MLKLKRNVICELCFFFAVALVVVVVFVWVLSDLVL